MSDSTDTWVRKNFAERTRHHLERVRKAQVRVHLPDRVQLHTRQKNASFHATPELFIQTGGATDFVCPGANFRLKTGEICVMPRGLPHAETPIDLKTPYQVLVFGDRFVIEGRADSARRILSHPFVMLEEEAHAFDRMRCLDDMAEYARLPKSDQKAYIRSLVETFLLTALCELKRPPRVIKETAPPLVVEAREYVHIHLSESSLTVQEIAAALACTPDHLSRLFRQVEGVKLMSWIAGQRVALAKNLLKETRHNVAEVGWASGFNEPSYFIRVFKRYTGMTPRSYRLALRRAST